MKKKKIKIKWRSIGIFLFFVVCLITLIISITNIIRWQIDNQKTDKEIEQVSDISNITVVEDNTKTEIIEQKEEIPKSNPYWDYVKMNLINVDFTELKKVNPETVGWIQVKGTNINYPFVQTKDNSYYLTHSFNKKYNKAGWIFLDYRNSITNLDKNTIIYGHSRLDKTMFGSLKNILTNGWLKNTNNYVIKLSTEKENTLWQVFSVYHIEETSDYLKTSFASDASFTEFTKMLLDRSIHNFNTSVQKDDKILTLSTCYKIEDRMVLHAKLIKREAREQ